MVVGQHLLLTLRKKCRYSELFWSASSRIRTECGQMWSISPYLVQMRENAHQNNSEYGHFLGSVKSGNFFVYCVNYGALHGFIKPIKVSKLFTIKKRYMTYIKEYEEAELQIICE